MFRSMAFFTWLVAYAVCWFGGLYALTHDRPLALITAGFGVVMFTFVIRPKDFL